MLFAPPSSNDTNTQNLTFFIPTNLTAMSRTPLHRNIYSGWYPTYPEVHAKFLERHVGSYGLPNAPVPKAPTDDLDKAVANLIQAIKDNDEMRSLSDLMFKQVNKDPKVCRIHVLTTVNLN